MLFEFRKDDRTITIFADTYNEALAALIFEIGSEIDAAEWLFVGIRHNEHSLECP